VALVRKGTTPVLVAANKANARKSTGPRTELGKARSSRNAGKHLVHASVSVHSMKELGENPAEFYGLRESLQRAFNPQDEFEQMLVDDMAEIRWRRRRLMRAEAGMAASQKREFEIERQWKIADYGKGLDAVANDMLVADMGLAALLRIPGQGGRDSEIIPVRIPK
jgi:hypothetical protein